MKAAVFGSLPFLAGLFVPMALCAQGTTPDADSVMLVINVNAAYDDTDSSYNEIFKLTEALPPTRIQSKQFQNLRALIFARYGISPGHPGEQHDSDLPRTYELLEQKIVCLNSMDSASGMLPSTMIVPSVPHRALSRPGANVYNRLPIIVRARVRGDTLPAGDCGQVLQARALSGTWDRIQSDSSPASQIVRMELWFSDDDFLALEGAAVWPILEADYQAKLETQSLPLEKGLELAAGRDTAAPDRVILPDSFATRLRAELQSVAAKRTVNLFILDTGWPDEASRSESLNELWQLITRARKVLRLGPPNARLRLPKFAPPSDNHVVEIAAALKDLVDLDPSRRVRIVYVPTSLEQGGGDALAELIYLNRIIELKDIASSRLEGALADTLPVDGRLRADAATQAGRVVRSLPAKIEAGSFVTDKALLESLLWVANLLAQYDSTLFFLNESWTVAKNGIRIAPPSPMWGLAVVAAGNNPIKNILDDRQGVDFASQSLPAGDVMAVLTMDRTGGRRCSSSKLVADPLDDVLAVGYDGWVSKDQCGTSFAAPRVAWFLAADEVLRTSTMNPKARPNELLRRLIAMRARHRLNDLLFTPSGFVGLDTKQ